MSLVNFVHRSSKPTQPTQGTFYWVDSNEKTQIWFASGNTASDLILLNDDRITDLISRVSDVEADIDIIQEVLENIKAELSDSDYETITEKVMSKLTWKVIE